MGKVLGPEFYTGEGYLKEDFDKTLYKKAADLLSSLDVSEKNFIYEFGCGVGYFAKELYDRGFKKYFGFDFSEKSLDHFSNLIPEYTFIFQNKKMVIKKIDSLKSKLIPNPNSDEFNKSIFGIVLEFNLDEDYKLLNEHFKIMNYLISLEFFEHIEHDLEIIECLRKGTNLIFSVPNRDYFSHVRHFEKIEDVYSRYGKLLDFISSEEIISKKKKNNKAYLFKCIRK